jgi:ankyrin repeat protein
MFKSDNQYLIDVNNQDEAHNTVYFTNQLAAQEMYRQKKILHDSNPELYNMIEINIPNNVAFRQACLNGHIKIAKGLYQERYKTNLISNKILVEMYEISDNNVKKWLRSLFPGITNCWRINKISPYLAIRVAMKQCSVDDTDVAKMLSFIIDIHYENELFFRTVCEYGYMDTAKMLLENAKTPIDISALDYDALRQSCNNNHINLAKWLYNLCSERISLETMTDIYNNAKKNSNTDLTEWLLSIH